MSNSTTPELLSDEALRDIEAQSQNKSLDYAEVDEILRRVPALCQNLRALREKHSRLSEVSGEWASLLDRIRLWSKCADGYPLDEHVNNITTENAALREQLAENARRHFDDARSLERQRNEALDQSTELHQRLVQVEKERERLLRGDFTPEEFQNLCHNHDIQVGFDAFADGCEAYQRKLFGRCRKGSTT